MFWQDYTDRIISAIGFKFTFKFKFKKTVIIHWKAIKEYNTDDVISVWNYLCSLIFLLYYSLPSLKQHLLTLMSSGFWQWSSLFFTNCNLAHLPGISLSSSELSTKETIVNYEVHDHQSGISWLESVDLLLREKKIYLLLSKVVYGVHKFWFVVAEDVLLWLKSDSTGCSSPNSVSVSLSVTENSL